MEEAQMARHYSEEFKKDAVQYLKDHPNMDKREAAKNLGMPYDTLYGWYKEDRKRTNPDAYDEGGRQTGAETAGDPEEDHGYL